LGSVIVYNRSVSGNSSAWGNKQIIKTNEQGGKVGVLETDYISQTFVWNQDAG